MSRPRITRVPSVTVEVLRLLVVLFGAGLGYQTARALYPEPDAVLGPFNAQWVGAIVGAGLGYSLGGVLVRWLLSTFDRSETVLDRMSPEQAVAGGFGALLGAALATLVSWPLFLVLPPLLAIPAFLFVVVSLALFGFRAGRRRRGAMLEAIGPRAGVAATGRQHTRLPKVLDTSVAIDGRVLDVVRAGFLAGRMLVPSPVLGELQAMADSGEDLRRARGRRGLDVLDALRHEAPVEVEPIGDEAPGVTEVDAKLVRICLDRPALLLTFDTNLAKAASLAGVTVLNMHALALALRPPVVVGDEVTLALAKPGKEAGQAVGYLDDGTMVVVESARARIGQDVDVVVTSVLMTANGRLVFARPADLGPSAVSPRPNLARPRPTPTGPTGPVTPASLRPVPGARAAGGGNPGADR